MNEPTFRLKPDDETTLTMAGLISTVEPMSTLNPNNSIPIADVILAAIKANQIPGVMTTEAHIADRFGDQVSKATESTIADLRAEIGALNAAFNERDQMLGRASEDRRMGWATARALNLLIYNNQDGIEPSLLAKLKAVRDEMHKAQQAGKFTKDGALAEYEAGVVTAEEVTKAVQFIASLPTPEREEETIERMAAASWDLHATRKWAEIPEDWKPFYRDNVRAAVGAMVKS